MLASEIETAFRDASAFLADALAKDYEDMAGEFGWAGRLDAQASMLLAAQHARRIAKGLRAEQSQALRVVQ